MMDLIILQAQTAVGAAIQIILMLLGAGLIAVITTYLYSKSKFQKEISSLRNKLDTSNREVARLNRELSETKKSLAEKTEQLENQLKETEEELKEAEEDLKEAEEELKETELELHEKEELLKRISERKHLIDYSSFGSATAEQKDDLKMISGIGPVIEEKLNSLDIYTFEQISKFSEKDREAVNEAIEYFPGRIERDEWISQAKELVYTGGKGSEVLDNIRKRKHRINYDRIGIAHKEDAQDLTAIHGIGGWIQEKLYALDIFTYEQISRFSEEDVHSVTEIIEFFPGRIERDNWVSQAKELLG
jgi:predicted flap endonuclease-1-like 5' DNA nuclease